MNLYIYIYICICIHIHIYTYLVGATPKVGATLKAGRDYQSPTKSGQATYDIDSEPKGVYLFKHINICIYMYLYIYLHMCIYRYLYNICMCICIYTYLLIGSDTTKETSNTVSTDVRASQSSIRPESKNNRENIRKNSLNDSLNIRKYSIRNDGAKGNKGGYDTKEVSDIPGGKITHYIYIYIYIYGYTYICMYALLLMSILGWVGTCI
jgi:hypothetical protein